MDSNKSSQIIADEYYVFVMCQPDESILVCFSCWWPRGRCLVNMEAGKAAFQFAVW